MNTMIKLAAGGLLAGLMAAGPASAQVVTFATGAQGSIAFSSGQAFAKIANEAGITVRPQAVAGYLSQLSTGGDYDFGMSSISEAAYLHGGTGNHDGRANPDVRLVGVMFPLTTGIMATAASGIANVDELKARAGELRIASDYPSSTIIPFYIGGALANGGMEYDDFQRVPVSSFVAGIEALGDGLVDVALVSLNNAAGKQAEAKVGTLQYISLNDDADSISRLKAYLPASLVVSFDANENLLGLGQAANIIRIPWVLLTHGDVSDDVVYEMTRALAEEREALTEAFGLFRLTTAESQAPASDVPYHPGALRYYEEAGIEVGG